MYCGFYDGTTTIAPAATIRAPTWETQMPVVEAGHAVRQMPRTTSPVVEPVQAALVVSLDHLLAPLIRGLASCSRRVPLQLRQRRAQVLRLLTRQLTEPTHSYTCQQLSEMRRAVLHTTRNASRSIRSVREI